MITLCRICRKSINDRRDVRWSVGGATLCSLACVWRYRGQERCV